MTTTFAYELASVLSAQRRVYARAAEGVYAVPWYLVVGEPGTGRTTAVVALNLRWPHGDRPAALNVPNQRCQYWMPEKAVFI
ncbi:MAG: hypothetical protein EXR75_16795, partial [Myxococcales bacterium]|nr:hypothetical protein [Myxococcales bacterium]